MFQQYNVHQKLKKKTGAGKNHATISYFLLYLYFSTVFTIADSARYIDQL